MKTRKTFDIALLASIVVVRSLLQAIDLAAQTPSLAAVPYTYREVQGNELKAYVFSAPGPEQRKPAVLLFHGGAWQLGDASWMFDRARDFADQHNFLADEMTGFSRLIHGHGFPFPSTQSGLIRKNISGINGNFTRMRFV